MENRTLKFLKENRRQIGGITAETLLLFVLAACRGEAEKKSDIAIPPPSPTPRTLVIDNTPTATNTVAPLPSATHIVPVFTFTPEPSPIPSQTPVPAIAPDLTIMPTEKPTHASSSTALPVAAEKPKSNENPLAGKEFYINPYSQLAANAEKVKKEYPDKTAKIDLVASQPTGIWLGEWSGDVGKAAADVMKNAAGKLPIFVLYNSPNRDQGGYSAGGAQNEKKYLDWVRKFANGVGNGEAVAVVEPDLIGFAAQAIQRDVADGNADMEQAVAKHTQLIKDTLKVLAQRSDIHVFLDVSTWGDPETTARVLQHIGPENFTGISLNVSKYLHTEEVMKYYEQLSSELDKLGIRDLKYVVDTSRNGGGNTEEYLNPAVGGIGDLPTTQTGKPNMLAELWIKVPGESDGTGGASKMPAGQFDQALLSNLIDNSTVLH